jgi:DNA-3-methyladenine glycosylase I
MSTTITGPDGKPRCRWCGAAPDFLHYHDTEWGFPVSDDHRLFEKLSLEGFQSGLSWRTILVKRENFRAAFDGFDFDKVARFTERDVRRLLKDEGIVRHRGKIEAVINNARQARELVNREGSLAAFHLAPRAEEQRTREAADCINVAGIRCLVERTEETGLEVCRPDHGICVHAGDRPDQRPRRGMCGPGQG